MKGVIFDLFNTLVWSPGFMHVLEEVFPGAPIKEICHRTFVEEAGSCEAMVRQVVADYGIKMSEPEMVTVALRFHQWAEERPFYPHTQETLRTLRDRGFRLGLLSNLAEFVEGTLRETRLERYFDVVGLSYKMHLGKPDPRAFQWVLDRMDLPADSVVMVGDNWELDVAPAIDMGLKGIQILRPWRKPGGQNVTSIEQLLDLPELARPL